VLLALVVFCLAALVVVLVAHAVREQSDASPPAAVARLQAAVDGARRHGRRLLLQVRAGSAADSALDHLLEELSIGDLLAAGFVVHTLEAQDGEAAARFVLAATGYGHQLLPLPALFELDDQGNCARRADLEDWFARDPRAAMLEWLGEPTPVRPAAKA
jgi:hypothetical protein